MYVYAQQVNCLKYDNQFYEYEIMHKYEKSIKKQ